MKPEPDPEMNERHQHNGCTESCTSSEPSGEPSKYDPVKHPGMKLAEALMERAELRNRISAISSRLNANSKVYEGEEPAEDPKRMLEELDTVIPRYAELIARINTANANTVASDGHTLAELMASRDALIAKAKVLNGLIDAAMETNHYRTPDMPKRVSTVDVRSLRRESDAASKEAREKDALIQATNWITEI